jgi:hypothetical protein
MIYSVSKHYKCAVGVSRDEHSLCGVAVYAGPYPLK